MPRKRSIVPDLAPGHDPDTLLVPLTQGFHAIIDAADGPLVANRLWSVLRAKSGCTYGITHIRKSESPNGPWHCLLHHWLLGRPAEGLEIDHINRNGLDNRRCNLRIVTHKVNMSNTRHVDLGRINREAKRLRREAKLAQRAAEQQNDASHKHRLRPESATMTIHELALLRQSHGFSQNQVSLAMGRAAGYVRRFEIGKRKKWNMALQSSFLVAIEDLVSKNSKKPSASHTGPQLQALRIGIGVTRAEMATAIGYHYCTVRDYETERRGQKPSLSFVKRFLAYLAQRELLSSDNPSE